MTREELRNRLEEHVDTYIVFHGVTKQVRRYFRNKEWYRNNRYSPTTTILISCLFHLVRIKVKNFIFISKERRNMILERDLDEALLCKDLNKILTEMDN